MLDLLDDLVWMLHWSVERGVKSGLSENNMTDFNTCNSVPAPLTAAYGEVNFEMVGFVCQCLALCFEASRLVMIEILLHGMKVRFTTIQESHNS